jgi:hypothetical protein
MGQRFPVLWRRVWRSLNRGERPKWRLKEKGVGKLRTEMEVYKKTTSPIFVDGMTRGETIGVPSGTHCGIPWNWKHRRKLPRYHPSRHLAHILLL